MHAMIAKDQAHVAATIVTAIVGYVPNEFVEHGDARSIA